jgi:hypothetical protein
VTTILTQGVSPRNFREDRREEVEEKIKKIDSKRHVPLPEEYRDCVYWEEFDLPVNKKIADGVIRSFRNYIYLKDEVEKLRPVQTGAVSNESSDSSEGAVEEGVEKGFLPVSSEQSLRWNDITFTFLSDAEVHIQFKENTKGRSITRSFDKIGFGDKRKGGDVPVTSWGVFLAAAKEQKIPHSFETRSRVESTVKDLRSKLKKMFPGINEDPIPYKKADRSYHFAFHLNPPWNNC